MRVRLLLLTLAASSFAFVPAAQAQGRGGRGGRGGFPGAPAAMSRGSDSAGVRPVERVSTTHHKITIDGKEIDYTANVGTMVLRNGDGKPQGTVFYVSYTRDGEQAADRPVTFFFNGGPGSSSIWLSMGLMSPMHAEMGPDGTEPSPPYHLVPNPSSPLDVTDLVQVDAMMTGYSRPAPGVPVTDFTGARNDIAMFGQFIRDYLDQYHRWASPKYLFGESYGTFRSAGLASELQSSEGIYLNGIMLLGTVLDLGYIAPSPNNDMAYAMYLPTYTATAWYHKKLSASMENESIQQVTDQSRQFAFGDYLVDLAKGNELTAAQKTAVAQKLASLTGVSEKFVLNTNLRIDPGVFRTQLLRDRGLSVGRYDSRLVGTQGNPSSQRQDYDPSDVAPSGAFMSAYMQYLHNDLDYSTNLQYYMGGHAGRWDYGGAGYGGYPSEIESLRSAMSKDPYLHVLVNAGYYDMATPFANAEYTFRHLQLNNSYPKRVQFEYYQSGHMAYLNQASAARLKANVAKFIESTEHEGETGPTH